MMPLGKGRVGAKVLESFRIQVALEDRKGFSTNPEVGQKLAFATSYPAFYRVRSKNVRNDAVSYKGGFKLKR
jgi:hypothetical protein